MPSLITTSKVPESVQAFIDTISWRDISITRYACLAIVSVLIFKGLANIYLSPIRKIPGPRLAAASDYWSLYHLCTGRRYLVVQRLFEKYNSPVVRTGPNSVVVRNYQYLPKVYQSKLDKIPAYDGFRTNHGTPNSFSCITNSEAQGKRRGMLPQYATSNLVEWQHVFDAHISATLNYLQGIGSEKPVDILALIAHGLVDILGEVVLDTQVGAVKDFTQDKPNPIVKAITYWPKRGTIKGPMHPLIWKTVAAFPGDTWQEFIQSDANLAAFVDPLVIKARMQLSQGSAPERPSLVHRLSTVTNSIAGGMWPASHVTSECIDHFLAGTETTSTSLAYTLYHLALHPDIMKKLQEELDSCVPANTVPGLQETARFPYLNAVIKESLRFYAINPGCLDRVVPAEGLLADGIFIPPGTHVGIQAWTTHHDPDVWTDPWKFWPERWFSETPEMKAAFIPFSVGGRSCPGQNIAMFDLRLFLATIARNFDVICPPETTWTTMEPFDLTTVSPWSGKCDLVFRSRVSAD